MANKAEDFKQQILKSHRLSLNETDLKLLESQLDVLITYVKYDEPSPEKQTVVLKPRVGLTHDE